MAGKIFLNYRRDDEAGFTTALYQRLEDAFAPGDLFMDVEGHIKPGDDFEKVLNAQVAAADVVLVVIGPRWADLLAARQDDRNDFVAVEIKAALDQGKRVIPVLVGGALLPRADTLPEAIRSLVFRQAVGLRPERFKADCQGLVTALKDSLAAAEQERAARTEAERKAAEAARQETEAQAAARVIAAEERGRMQAAAGLSAEDVRKAEELASWDFVKDQNDAQELRDHLARFPNGTTERWARAKLDGLVWAGLGSTPAVEQLRAYLDEFPNGANAKEAQARIAALEWEAAEAKLRAQETVQWGGVSASTNKTAIESFLKRWPSGQHVEAARARIAELRRGIGGLRLSILLGTGAIGAIVLALVVLAWLPARQPSVPGPSPSRPTQTPSSEKLDAAEKAAAERAAAERAARPDPALSVQPGSGQSFRDRLANGQPCPTCPEMVVAPNGKFTMGSPASEPQRDSDEKQVAVSIAKPFAVGKFAVTRGEFAAFVEETGHETNGTCLVLSGSEFKYHTWRAPGFEQDDRHPVVCVNRDDAKAYAEWLSRKTGNAYRLLSESEREYVTRAGTTTPFWWGISITPSQANYNGNLLYAGGGSKGEFRQRTVPVDSFKPNPWGLYNVHGNALEWTEDCWNRSNSGNPGNGSARMTGDCWKRVVRGGSWDDLPQDLRSADRTWNPAVGGSNHLGFRVGRTLIP